MGLHDVLGLRGISTVQAGIPTPTAILHVQHIVVEIGAYVKNCRRGGDTGISNPLLSLHHRLTELGYSQEDHFTNFDLGPTLGYFQVTS